MRDLDPAQPQRIAAVARFPCPFEPVAGQGNDKECCPRTSADIASGKHCSDADDGKGRPAEASHDAVCLPASGKVGEAVGTEDQEEGPLHQETNRRAERSAHKPDNGDREKDVAAPEKGGGEAGVSVQRPLDAVAWRSHRRRTRSAHARPLCPPRIHSSLFHAGAEVPIRRSPTPAISSRENEPGRRCHLAVSRWRVTRISHARRSVSVSDGHSPKAIPASLSRFNLPSEG